MSPAVPVPGLPYWDVRFGSCAKCRINLASDGYHLRAEKPEGTAGWWTLCGACFELLVATIVVEVEAGPGTPKPEAWTKVRKLRAARERRWGKADP